MDKILKNLVINEFSSPTVQALYVTKAEEGLWESEKILIKKYFEPKSTVLDIGCGTGRTTIHLNKLEYKATGIDITPVMINNAREIAKSKKMEIAYEIGDVTNLKFKSSSFDNALFSFNGWAMIPGKINRVNALKEVFRVLKPGGHFIFTSLLRNTSGYKFFWTRQWIKLYIIKQMGFKIREVDFGDHFFKIEGGRKPFNDKQFMHFPSLKEVKDQIAKVGFDLIFCEKSDNFSNGNNGEAPPMFYVCKKANPGINSRWNRFLNFNNFFQ